MRALLLLALFLSGCAARASYFVFDAQRDYEAAVNAGGEERAVYETTLAREYLWKAKEEVNSSDYGAAEQVCKKSMAWSAEAYEKSADDGPNLDKTDEFVPETKPEEVKKPETPNTLDDIDLDDL